MGKLKTSMRFFDGDANYFPESVAYSGSDDDQPNSGKDDFKKLDFAHREALRKNDLNYVDPERVKALKTQRRVQTLFAAAFRKAGKQAVKHVVSALSDLGKADGPEEEIDIDEVLNGLEIMFIADVGDGLVEDLAELYADSASEALAQIGTPMRGELVDVVNERALAWATDYAGVLVGTGDNPEFSIPQSTREMLRATISKGISDNLSAEDIGTEIAKSYAFSEERAETIAMTEVASANSYGALEGYREAENMGIKLKKSWLRLGDACPVCVDNAGAGKIPLDDPFPSGDMAPPAHPHCRCVLVPEVEEGVEKSDAFKEGKTNA